jgi:hypothetical protein
MFQTLFSILAGFGEQPGNNIAGSFHSNDLSYLFIAKTQSLQSRSAFTMPICGTGGTQLIIFSPYSLSLLGALK